MQNRVQIRGVWFRYIGTSTFQQNCWTTERIRLCGIDRIEAEPGETARALAVRVWIQVAGNEHGMDLLGGLLIPEGTPDASWTPELAATTSKFLSGSTELQDKQALRNHFYAALESFFSTVTNEWKRGDGKKPVSIQRSHSWVAPVGSA